eukprot:gene4245-4072_t
MRFFDAAAVGETVVSPTVSLEEWPVQVRLINTGSD